MCFASRLGGFYSIGCVMASGASGNLPVFYFFVGCKIEIDLYDVSRLEKSGVRI